MGSLSRIFCTEIQQKYSLFFLSESAAEMRRYSSEPHNMAFLFLRRSALLVSINNYRGLLRVPETLSLPMRLYVAILSLPTRSTVSRLGFSARLMSFLKPFAGMHEV